MLLKQFICKNNANFYMRIINKILCYNKMLYNNDHTSYDKCYLITVITYEI